MLNWLKRRGTREKIPAYAAIQKVPSRGLPADLAEREAGQAFSSQREEVERSLREPPRCPTVESPLFVGLLASGQAGVVTMGTRIPL